MKTLRKMHRSLILGFIFIYTDCVFTKSLKDPHGKNFVEFSNNNTNSPENGKFGRNFLNKPRAELQDDGKPHLIPLNFVANVPAGGGETFSPERSGLLLHEYYDELFQMFPKFKKIFDLQYKVLRERDPLIQKNNPYGDEIDMSIMDHLSSAGNRPYEINAHSTQLTVKGKKQFILEAKEEAEYTKTTKPPLIFNPFVPKSKGNEENDGEIEVDL